MTTIALTGGGTAGHITPMRAVGEALRLAHKDVSLVVIGTESGREKELLPTDFGDIIEVAKLPFPRTLSLDALRFPGRFVKAVARLRKEFRDRRIDVVAGFGGYTAAPAYVAAWRENIPLVIHEANVLPGLANRLGARLTTHVATCFPGTALPHHVTVGMPLPHHIVDMDRESLAPEGYQLFGLDPTAPVLLITGGSSGAKKLNEALIEQVPKIVGRGWQVLHLVGPTLNVPAGMPEGYVAIDYCRRMELAYSVADVVISRAGAATVSELAVAGLPAILVPYHVGNGEQHKNARFLVDEGAALVVNQDDLDGAYIDRVVIPLLDDDTTRSRMAEAAARLGVTDAADRFADMVYSARKVT